jgi:hypothetical protein
MTDDDVMTVGSIDLGDLLPVRPRTILTPARRSCRECDYSAMEGPDRVCRFNPPQVTFIAVPGQKAVNTPQGMRTVPALELKNFTGFPIVQHEQWCGQFAPKVRQ